MKSAVPNVGPVATKKIFENIVADIKELFKDNADQDLEIKKLKGGGKRTVLVVENASIQYYSISATPTQAPGA